MELETPLSSEEELTESESDDLINRHHSLRFKKTRNKRKRRKLNNNQHNTAQLLSSSDEETESTHDNADKAPVRAVKTRKRTFSSTQITNTTTTLRSRRRAVSKVKPKNNKDKEDKASKKAEDSDIDWKPKKIKTKKRKRSKKQDKKEPPPKRVKRLKLSRDEIIKIFKENGAEAYVDKAMNDGLFGFSVWDNMLARHWRALIPKIGPRRRVQNKIRELIDGYNETNIAYLDQIYGFKSSDMVSITAVLEEMGMERYNQVFKDNEIEFCDLRHLEPSDWIKLIDSRANRQRMKKMAQSMNKV
eukprot:273395_1